MNNEEERSKQNPATQAPILTKPKRQKLQAMEIGSDMWFLTVAPVEERSNDAKTQAPITKPRWFLADYQTQAMEIRSDTRFLAAAPVEEKNTLESGFDFLFWI